MVVVNTQVFIPVIDQMTNLFSVSKTCNA